MANIYEILRCPVCRGRIDQGLRCADCGGQYRECEGVPVLISPSVTKCRSCWDSVDFAAGRAESMMETYRRFLNPQTREAREAWIAAMVERVRSMEGLAADVATGLWDLAQGMLDSNPGIVPVSTDLDPWLLAWKRDRVRCAGDRERHSVACDAHHFPFADGAFGGIANADGLINMDDAAAFLAEMRRTLKPGGRLALMHRLFSPDSRSYALARVYGIHRALEPGPLTEMLEAAGFRDARVVEVSRAVWSENPGQSFPVAGDLQIFAIVEAVR